MTMKNLNLLNPSSRKEDGRNNNDDSILQHRILGAKMTVTDDDCADNHRTNDPVASENSGYNSVFVGDVIDVSSESQTFVESCLQKDMILSSELSHLPKELNFPDDVKPELAMAWFVKRAKHLREDEERKRQDEHVRRDKNKKLEPRNLHAGLASFGKRSAASVDVDIMMNDSVDVLDFEQHNSYQGKVATEISRISSSKSLASTLRYGKNVHPTWRLSPEHQHADHSFYDDDAATHMSGVSKAQSEKTQITSNVPPEHSDATSSLAQHSNPTRSRLDKFGVLPYNNTKSATSSSSDGEREQRVDDSGRHGDGIEEKSLFGNALKGTDAVFLSVEIVGNNEARDNVCYTMQDQQQRNTKKIKFLEIRRRLGNIWFVVILFMVLLVISVSVLMSQQSKRKNDETSFSEQGKNNEDEVVKVPTVAPYFHANNRFSTQIPVPGSSEDTNSNSMTLLPTETDFNRHSDNAVDERDTPVDFLQFDNSSRTSESFTSVSFTGVEITLGENTKGASFGASITLSQSGNIYAVGAPNAVVNGVERAGRVEVYERQQGSMDTQWRQRGPTRLFRGRVLNGAFGSAVSMNADGSVIAVSAPSHNNTTAQYGTVHVYQYDPADEEYSILGSVLSDKMTGSAFGASIQLSASGQYLVVGAPFHSDGDTLYQGTVFVYQYDSGIGDWKQLAWPLIGTYNNDRMGSTVAILEDFVHKSFTIAASAPNNNVFGGYVRVWKYNNGAWIKLADDLTNKNLSYVGQTALLSYDLFGNSLSLTKRMAYVGSEPNRTSHWYNRLYVAVGIPLKDDLVKGIENMGMTAVYQLDMKGYDSSTSTNEKSHWELVGQPIISNNAAGDEAGHTVQFLQPSKNSRKVLLVAVGAPGANRHTGSVRWYRYDSVTNGTATWVQVEGSEALFTGNHPGEEFGSSLAIAESSDGDVIMVVGAPMSQKGSINSTKDNNKNNSGGYVAVFTFR